MRKKYKSETKLNFETKKETFLSRKRYLYKSKHTLLFVTGGHQGQSPFLAAQLAAMAAAASAAASKQPQNSPQSPQGQPGGLQQAAQAAAAAAAAAGSPSSLFPFGLNGWQPPVSAPPSFPPLGFPGFQHPLFKPGNLQIMILA